MKPIINVLSIMSLFSITACEMKDFDSEDRFKERVGQEATQQQAVEKQTRESLVKDMEADLSIRQRAYQAMKGSYEGFFEDQDNKYRITAEFVPTVLPFNPESRVRTPDELQEDLNNLAFNVKISIRDLKTQSLLVSCSEKSIKLSLTDGTLSWLSESESCSNTFAIRMQNQEAPLDESIRSQKAKDTVKALMQGEKHKVTLDFKMRPSASEQIFATQLKRIEL